MTDYLCIGSNGFAQVGDPCYYKKNVAERQIILSIIEENEILHIPDEFQGIARYAWKAFDHEFGTYHELVVIYYEDRLERASNDSINRFYDWINELEGFDFETPEITKRIEELYYNLNPEEKCIVKTLKRAS